ncbi:hypothetical protein, partial [Pseudomonas aeruginosa]|uniref:hypothetical protein n=1 Tax=Pseudomonas aeruginosa TaxID=287 RepID=UPI0022CE0EF3
PDWQSNKAEQSIIFIAVVRIAGRAPTDSDCETYGTKKRSRARAAACFRVCHPTPTIKCHVTTAKPTITIGFLPKTGLAIYSTH